MKSLGFGKHDLSLFLCRTNNTVRLVIVQKERESRLYNKLYINHINLKTCAVPCVCKTLAMILHKNPRLQDFGKPEGERDPTCDTLRNMCFY